MRAGWRPVGRGTNFIRMVGNQQAAALADAMQADYFRAFLCQLRSELETDHAKLVKRMTAAQVSGDLRAVGVMRRAIRTAEGDLRAVVRMVDALDVRFPGVAAPRTG